MTEKELAALETAAKVATPGPWLEAPLYEDRIDTPMQIIAHREHADGERVVADCGYSIDSQFIAAANPAAVLELIAELRQARRERDWLAEKNQDAPCELGMECLHPDSSPKNKNRICDPAECWRELAAKVATCKN